MTAIYSSTADVERVLQLDFPFSGTSYPTSDDVIATIEDVQDEIDHETKHSWREIKVSDEYYDFSRQYPSNYMNLDPGIPIFLRHRQIRPMGSASDKLEIWEGGTAYVDYLATKTQGRNDDFWVDEERGIIYLKQVYPFFTEKAARITYRYGGSVVPKDIRRAATYMTAIELIEGDNRSHFLSDTGMPNQLNMATRVDRMQAKVDKILRNRSEVIVI